jgi:SAM-dependent methyltransferase
MSPKNRFGYQWSKYNAIVPLYEQQFKSWIYSMQPGDFAGLQVLDAGCGAGRNSYWPLRYGAKEVVAFDVDPRTVAAARHNLAGEERARCVEASIYGIPFESEFDVVFSIGVVHHLAEPRKAMRQLVKAAKPGGKILVWVYGKEGHTFVKNLVDGVRKLTCRIPEPLLNVLVAPLSFLWYFSLKLLPTRHPYLRLLKSAPFWAIHTILFDQLVPDISNYWTQQEAVALFDGLEVENVQSGFCNEGSWTVWATRLSA